MKSLHNEADFEEVKSRLSHLKATDLPQWGKMNAAQMLQHCALVLDIPCGKTVLPNKGFLVRMIGVATKREMKIFGNGIPHNMPTYRVLLCNDPCDFEQCRARLQVSLEDYRRCYLTGNLPEKHELFGTMKVQDWGFLEYKHLHHHLKQFGI